MQDNERQSPKEIDELVVVAARAVFAAREAELEKIACALQAWASAGQIDHPVAQGLMETRDGLTAASELLYHLIMDLRRDERIIALLNTAWVNKTPWTNR